MKRNEEKVAQLLVSQPNDWITAKEISDELGFSIRSVKTYIKEINTIHDNAIFSSRKGYKANLSTLSAISDTSKRTIAETQDERIALLLKKLIDATRPLDIYEISDFFFISETTARADLNTAKQLVKKRALTIHSHRNQIYLEGSERNKRMLLNDLFNSEVATALFSFDTMRSFYGEEKAEAIREIVINTFFEHTYFTNDYLLNNIVLHIAIALERITLNLHLDTKVKPMIVDDTSFHIAKEISKKIEEKYQVEYIENEVNDLAILIGSSTNAVNYMHIDLDKIEEIVGQDTMTLIEEIIEEVRGNYYINLNDSNFKVRFALHIKNLILRLKHGTKIKNPMTKTIKRECPLIYDCAVSVSSIIEDKIGIQLSDDEIAYLSFHLGYVLESYNDVNRKINYCLLSPVYYNMNKEIISKLSTYFGEDLSIQNVLTDEKDLRMINCDLIISTIQLNVISETPCVFINPFIGEKDKKNIGNIINEIQKQRETNSFKDNLKSVISKRIFTIDNQVASKEQAIQTACDLMFQNGYCDENYINEVIKRERLSSTAFGKIAIPHSMKMNGLNTGMSIIINPEGIKWDDQKIYIVLLLCIQKNDKRIYHEIFDKLSDVLTVDSIVQKLISVKDYDSFIETLFKYL
ncbi:BglG family transcription antiterminator [Amphibacillus sp. Q70]|uniref:BglG family transcription antiterminator n=1 Tax=Amphibacillus sp. Q70 TaxID=3453416 RepID=UPI003F834115